MIRQHFYYINHRGIVTTHGVENLGQHCSRKWDMPGHTKPLAEPKLAQSCDNNLRVISQGKSITKIRLANIYFKFHTNLTGSNELTSSDNAVAIHTYVTIKSMTQIFYLHPSRTVIRLTVDQLPVPSLLLSMQTVAAYGDVALQYRIRGNWFSYWTNLSRNNYKKYHKRAVEGP